MYFVTSRPLAYRSAVAPRAQTAAPPFPCNGRCRDDRLSFDSARGTPYSVLSVRQHAVRFVSPSVGGSMSLSTNHKVSALRSAILAAVTVGLMLAPASAQADPVREGNCTAQLTAVEGEDAATFTIRCSEGVQGLQFRTSEDV